MNVGVRELRDGLSRYLAEVRAGHTVTVTDHGRPIARLVPVDTPIVLERLVDEGRLMPASARKRLAPKPLATASMVSDLIALQRR